MQILAVIAIAAITLHKVLANDLFLILLQKLLNHVIFILLNHVIFILLKIPDELLTYLLPAYCLDDVSLVVIFIQNKLLTLVTVVRLIIILKHIRLVVCCAAELQVLLEII